MERKLIDAHMHVPQWSSQDGSLVFESLQRYMDSHNLAAVDNMCCSSDGTLWAGYEMDQSILGAIAKMENPNVFAHGCLYIPLDHDQLSKFRFADQLEELMALGMDGVKICDFKPDAYRLFRVDRLLREYEAYFDICQKYNVHMCWHVADPRFCWDPAKAPENFRKLGWFYGDGQYPTYDGLIQMTLRWLDMFPKLNVMLAHAFFHADSPDKMEALLEKYPNVTIDLAPGMEMFGGFGAHYEQWHRIFRVFSHRFLYATDADVNGSPEYLSSRVQPGVRFLSTEEEFEVPGGYRTRGIGLEQEHLDRIFWKNHREIVGQKPREIDRAALKKYIQRYLPLMPDSKNKHLTEIYYRKHLLG